MEKTIKNISKKVGIGIIQKKKKNKKKKILKN